MARTSSRSVTNTTPPGNGYHHIISSPLKYASILLWAHSIDGDVTAAFTSVVDSTGAASHVIALPTDYCYFKKIRHSMGNLTVNGRASID
jgi:hypothetical protein